MKAHLDRMTDKHGEDPTPWNLADFQPALRLGRLVTEMHDREHAGVARWCDIQACREAWEILL